MKPTQIQTTVMIYPAELIDAVVRFVDRARPGELSRLMAHRLRACANDIDDAIDAMELSGKKVDQPLE